MGIPFVSPLLFALRIVNSLKIQGRFCIAHSFNVPPVEDVEIGLNSLFATRLRNEQNFIYTEKTIEQRYLVENSRRILITPVLLVFVAILS